MTDWILIIIAGGLMSVTEADTQSVTKQQCFASLEVLKPLAKNGLGAACIGPDGQTLEMEQ